MPSDTFNLAGPIESNPAAAWAKIVGATISSDGNFATGGVNTMYHWLDPAINADKQYTQVLIPEEIGATNANTFTGGVRLQDGARSGYAGYYYKGGSVYGWAVLLRIDNGSMVPLGSGIQTTPPPLSLRLEMEGNQLVLKKMAAGDSDWVTIRSATDATYPSGKVGLISATVSYGFFLDTWEGGSLGVPASGGGGKGLLLRGVG
ncbi:MAG: hypothetical protein IT442_17950 [Phycisphaeraceae bacterium]|nr:hypothetical protein [Phycisphaeraceae bacterium]